MKANLLALSGMLMLGAACGPRHAEDHETRAAVEDTSVAPSTDVGTPSRDTVADTGSREVRMRPYDGPLVNQGDTVDTSGGSPR
jgi:hypothetical protein